MRRRAFVGLLFVAAVPGSAALPASPDVDWLVGRDLTIQRGRPLTASWSQTPVREALAELSRSQRVAMLLDRRIDPDRPVSLSIDAVALEDAVAQIAHECQADVSWFGPLAYLGPPAAAQRLRTLAALRDADAERLSGERRQRFAHPRSWSWEDLATPRELCQSLAAEARVRLESLDLLPHDLWAAADLPPLTWIERLTLLANEFDLTFEFADDGAAVRLTPVVEPVRIERRYAGGKQPVALARRYAELAPEAEVERFGGGVIVRGRIEDHERLTEQPKRVSRGKPGKQVFTVRADEQPLSAVLDQLRSQLRLTLNIDEAALRKAGISLDRSISFDVKRATLEELLFAVLRPAGLTYRGEGREFEIFPDANRGPRDAD
ncbi:MAG TPA: hypothetical protein VF306_17235 [Pirellulales bacterium]